MCPDNLKQIAAATEQTASRNALINAANEIAELRRKNERLSDALMAFDSAAKESASIIGFAGKALSILKQARATINEAGA